MEIDEALKRGNGAFKKIYFEYIKETSKIEKFKGYIGGNNRALSKNLAEIMADFIKSGLSAKKYIRTAMKNNRDMEENQNNEEDNYDIRTCHKDFIMEYFSNRYYEIFNDNPNKTIINAFIAYLNNKEYKATNQVLGDNYSIQNMCDKFILSKYNVANRTFDLDVRKRYSVIGTIEEAYRESKNSFYKSAIITLAGILITTGLTAGAYELRSNYENEVDEIVNTYGKTGNKDEDVRIDKNGNTLVTTKKEESKWVNDYGGGHKTLVNKEVLLNDLEFIENVANEEVELEDKLRMKIDHLEENDDLLSIACQIVSDAYQGKEIDPELLDAAETLIVPRNNENKADIIEARRKLEIAISKKTYVPEGRDNYYIVPGPYELD